jgi:hypothetical protein
MKSKLLFLIFILAAISWDLIVTVIAAQHGFAIPSYCLDCPWAGIALGTLGGFCIGALGLRMYAKVSHQEKLRRINRNTVRHVEIYPDPLEPCQVGHREPYINYNKAVVR